MNLRINISFLGPTANDHETTLGSAKQKNSSEARAQHPALPRKSACSPCLDLPFSV